MKLLTDSLPVAHECFVLPVCLSRCLTGLHVKTVLGNAVYHRAVLPYLDGQSFHDHATELVVFSLLVDRRVFLSLLGLGKHVVPASSIALMQT